MPLADSTLKGVTNKTMATSPNQHCCVPCCPWQCTDPCVLYAAGIFFRLAEAYHSWRRPPFSTDHTEGSPCGLRSLLVLGLALLQPKRLTKLHFRAHNPVSVCFTGFCFGFVSFWVTELRVIADHYLPFGQPHPPSIASERCIRGGSHIPTSSTALAL